MAGGGLRPESGELAHRRQELGGEGARGGHGLPRGGLGAAKSDRRRAVRCGSGPAAMAAALRRGRASEVGPGRLSGRWRVRLGAWWRAGQARTAARCVGSSGRPAAML